MSEVKSDYPLDRLSGRFKLIVLVLSVISYLCGLLYFYNIGGMEEFFFERLLMAVGAIFLSYCLLLDKDIRIGLVSFDQEDKRPHKLYITLAFVFFFGIAPFINI